MDAFMAGLSIQRPSSIRTPSRFAPDNDGKELDFLEKQDTTDLPSITIPKVENSSESLLTNSGECSKSLKKYSLFVSPNSQDELERYCFFAIGQGVTFCLKKDCTTSHRGSSRIEIKINEGIIMKTKSEGFLTPRTATSKFNSEVIQAWQRESMILSDWINVFNLANLSEADKLSSATKLTATDLENRQVILSKSLAFQTPGGGKRKFKRIFYHCT